MAKIEMKKQKVSPLVFETYLAVIKNSVGTKMFRHFYARVDGQKQEIMRGGDLSCAFYASSVLALFGFIKKVHGTVGSTVEDLKKSGWKEVDRPKVGSVLVWEKVDFGNGEFHKHIGFFVGKNKAVSNSSKLGYPVEHDWNFEGQRKVETILWKKFD